MGHHLVSTIIPFIPIHSLRKTHHPTHRKKLRPESPSCWARRIPSLPWPSATRVSTPVASIHGKICRMKPGESHHDLGHRKYVGNSWISDVQRILHGKRHLENGGHLGLEVHIYIYIHNIYIYMYVYIYIFFFFVPKMFHYVSTSCLIWFAVIFHRETARHQTWWCCRSELHR